MRLKASLAGGTKERRTLMDIEKLIEQLNGYFEGKDLKRGVALDAATALSALQAENEKLRAELKRLTAENEQLKGRAMSEAMESAISAGKLVLMERELERVTRERDAAVEDLHKLCPAWKWDGQKED